MEMDPSELNKYLHAYQSVVCLNRDCRIHLGIRHKELSDGNFCSMDCLLSSSAQAFLASTGSNHPHVDPMYQIALSAALQAMSIFSAVYSPINHPFYNNKGFSSPINLCTSGYDTIDSANAAAPKDGCDNKVVEIEEKKESNVKRGEEFTGCEIPKKQGADPAKIDDTPAKKARMSEIVGVNAKESSAGNPFFTRNQQKVDTPSQAQHQNEVAAKKPAPVEQPAKRATVKCKNVTCHPGPSALKPYFGKFLDIKIGHSDPKWQVIRTHANKTTDLYFQTPEMQDMVAELSDDLQQYVAKGYGAELNNYKIGDICIAPFSGDFYRGIITKFQVDNVKVYFMDFGNEETISKEEKIYRLPSIFERIPRLACHGQWDLALSKETSDDELMDMLTDLELNTNIISKITDGQYLIRIGDRAPKMQFKITPDIVNDPDLEEVYDVEKVV